MRWYIIDIKFKLQARATLGYREKKMSPGKVCKSVYYAVYILILYIMIIISRSLSRWHSFGSISNASTT